MNGYTIATSKLVISTKHISLVCVFDSNNVTVNCPNTACLQPLRWRIIFKILASSLIWINIRINQKQLSSNYPKYFLPRCICYNFGGENPSLDNGTLTKKLIIKRQMQFWHFSWVHLELVSLFWYVLYGKYR